MQTTMQKNANNNVNSNANSNAKERMIKIEIQNIITLVGTTPAHLSYDVTAFK